MRISIRLKLPPKWWGEIHPCLTGKHVPNLSGPDKSLVLRVLSIDAELEINILDKRKQRMNPKGIKYVLPIFHAIFPSLKNRTHLYKRTNLKAVSLVCTLFYGPCFTCTLYLVLTQNLTNNVKQLSLPLLKLELWNSMVNVPYHSQKGTIRILFYRSFPWIMPGLLMLAPSLNSTPIVVYTSDIKG